MRASTNACASDGSLSVGILIGYSVPCPPGAVIRVPAEYRSARSAAWPALCSLRLPAAKCTSVNMSSTVVTPKMSCCLSIALVQTCACASMSPGSSVLPLLSITCAPSGTAMFGPTAAMSPSRTSTSAWGITRAPSNTRALRNTSGAAAGKTETAALKNPTARRGLRNDMLCYQLNLAGALQSETSEDCRRAPRARGPGPARAERDVPQRDLRAPPPEPVGTVAGNHPFRAAYRQPCQRMEARVVRPVSQPARLRRRASGGSGAGY